MNIDKKDLLLYAVTDSMWTGEESLKEQVKKALDGGITCLQLREKEMPEDEFIREAKEIQALCKEYKVPFIINDNVNVALAVGADGLHIGQNDGDIPTIRKQIGDMILGVSAKTVEQAVYAYEQGADYLGVGAVFPTSTKPDATGVSKRNVRAIRSAVPIPIVAIGGITQSNLTELRGLGLDGVAVVSAIFGAKDILEATKKLRESTKEIFWQHKLPIALTIAGSDSGGGAGIQADLKTMTNLGVFGTSVITAITAQNTKGVTDIFPIPDEVVQSQLDALWDDLMPDAIKLGMLASHTLIELIAHQLKKSAHIPVVCDPVMVSTSGAKLIGEEAQEALKQHLFPLVSVITPNIPEAEVLTGMRIQTPQDMETAAKFLYDTYGCATLVKGGHKMNDANDCLYSKGGITWFYGERIDNDNTHGTGCTLSSAIASELAKGLSLEEAIHYAKSYISMILSAQLDLGDASGPMDHAFTL